MAQDDYAVADAAGATFRADINSQLVAIVTQNSGATQPATTFSGMWWYDTTADILKKRNEANSAWIELIHFDQTNGLFRIDFDKGADIASAATTDIWAATGNYATITGVATITSLGTGKAGSWRLVRFAGALLLTHNPTSLILQGAANITTAAGDMALVVSEGTSNARVTFFPASGESVVAAPISMATAPPEISNGTDATNDIDVVAKACRDDLDTFNMPAGVALGKQIDVAWVEGGTPGAPAGGYAGAVALANDTWYHFFKIAKPDGTVDAGYDDSPTAVNLLAAATGYTTYRRLNSVRRLTATNKLFTQIGDKTLWNTPVLEISAQAMSTGSETLRTLMSPPDFRTEVEFHYRTNVITGNGPLLYFRTPDTTDSAPSGTAAPLHTNDGVFGNAATTSASGGRERIITNTSSQIAERSNVAGNISEATIAYTDRRGRDG